jgi:2-polyprenyl-6-methoxyphenol hydroxylase-like FAD-dependent oxidoreductase
MARIGRQAIVVGASMGGLLAARVLSEYFGHVTMFERDATPDSREHRKGVPQSRSTHGLLTRGSRTLETLFPGFRDDILAEGAIDGDIVDGSIWHISGVTLKSAPSDLRGYLVSRPTLENTVRRRVRRLANVEIVERCDARGLVIDADRGRVAGVRVRAAGSGDESHVVAGDLVVDASGRAALGQRWLPEIGYRPAPEERVEIGTASITRLFRRRPQDAHGKNIVVVGACPPDWRFGVMLAQEDDRWTVTLGGYFGDEAPADDAGFVEFARRLPRREIYEVVRNAAPLSEPIPYHFQASVRRRFERLSVFPDGYLVFGDGHCSFNPSYGQGMSVACAEAMALDECLRAGTGSLARRFFNAAAKVIDAPWQIAVGSDLRHPRVLAPRPAPVRFVNWYLGRLHYAAQSDAVLTARFLAVANLLEPPASLFAPGVLWRVWRGQAGDIETRALAIADAASAPEA